MEHDHRALAVATYNATWELIDKQERTREEDHDMLGRALTSRHHWREVGDARNHAISDWQVSRVLSLLGAADLARSFAEASMETCRNAGLDAFVTGCAEEALARALLTAGDGDAARRALERARRIAAGLDDAEEREVLEADLGELAGRL